MGRWSTFMSTPGIYLHIINQQENLEGDVPGGLMHRRQSHVQPAGSGAGSVQTNE